jgi:hypothetical protein
LKFWGPGFNFDTHQSEAFLTDPDGLGLSTPTQGTGYKYRGRGFIQLTGPHQFVEAGKNLKNLGVINDPMLLFKYPGLIDDNATLSDFNLPPETLIGADLTFVRNAASVYGMWDKVINALGGTLDGNGQIAGKGDTTREQVLNRLQCIDDKWVGTYIPIRATTGMARGAGWYRERVEGKSKHFYDDGFGYSVNKSGILKII